MSMPWSADFAARCAAFAPLCAVAEGLAVSTWPDCRVLNERAAARALRNSNGLALRFVAQSVLQSDFAQKYEPRIYLRGEVQMRENNWHDLFNALVWLTFPRAKAALNARHYRALCAQQALGAVNRGPQQDALTLFDEGGVVVMSAQPALARLLREHAWKMLFWEQRAALAGALGFFVFGHALYEKALQPYTGMTGRGVIMACDAAFFDLPLALQLEEIDGRLADILHNTDRFTATHELAAVPLLGVPGWCAENAVEGYYDNRRYFRPLPLTRSLR